MKTQNNILDIIEKTLQKDGIEPESHFFKEGDFAAELEISRSKVREAISSLEIRGYVKRIHGRGVQAIDRSVEAVSNSISDLLGRSNFDYQDIVTLRKIVEVQGAGLAAEKRTDENLKKMEELLKIMNRKVSYKKYLEADLLFHQEVINATQNRLLSALIKAYSKVMQYAIEVATDENYRPEPVKKHHQKIYEAIKSGDRYISEMCMDSHLNASVRNVGTLNKIDSISW